MKRTCLLSNCKIYFQMSLKVHQSDKLHSPHVHSLKAFPGVVLVNHFPPSIPENHPKSFAREMKGWLMLTRHFSAPGKPARLLPLSPSASASDRESTLLLLVIHHLQWNFLPCSSATSNQQISKHFKSPPLIPRRCTSRWENQGSGSVWPTSSESAAYPSCINANFNLSDFQVISTFKEKLNRVELQENISMFGLDLCPLIVHCNIWSLDGIIHYLE